MENTQQLPKQTDMNFILRAIRPFSFSASMIPIIAGAMYAWYLQSNPTIIHPIQINWLFFPIVILASLLIHSGTNLVSEYYDYEVGVDRLNSFGSSRVLVESLIAPKKILYSGYVCFALTFILGMILVSQRGLPMLAIGIIGIIGGMFYSNKPFGYKYLALGDILVFILMGPLMVYGSFYALTGLFNINVLWISVPIGFLVTAILHANNTRDIADDTSAGIKTFAILIGLKASKIEYYFLEIGAYLSVVVMILTGVLEYWSLIVLLSLPPAIANMKEISTAEIGNPQKIAMMDIKTAQHHMLFGLLLSISLVISKFF